MAKGTDLTASSDEVDRFRVSHGVNTSSSLSGFHDDTITNAF